MGIQACVHLALVTAFAAVWGWHLTPQANAQDVAKQFGWFFNYLTFFSFSVQLLQFIVCLLADLRPKVYTECSVRQPLQQETWHDHSVPFNYILDNRGILEHCRENWYHSAMICHALYLAWQFL